MLWLYVAVGGAIGSMCRYALSVMIPVTTGQLPWATWWANILGCAGAGLFLAISERFAILQGDARLLLLVGFLGGFTTFSSFSVETFQMLRHNEIILAMSYVTSSLIIGLIALVSVYYAVKFLLN